MFFPVPHRLGHFAAIARIAAREAIDAALLAALCLLEVGSLTLLALSPDGGGPSAPVPGVVYPRPRGSSGHDYMTRSIVA